jgi:hypothetical protein
MTVTTVKQACCTPSEIVRSDSLADQTIHHSPPAGEGGGQKSF